VLLFLLALDMIFASPTSPSSRSRYPCSPDPGAITTVLLYTGGRDLAGIAVFVGVLLVILLITLVALLLSPRIMRLFGETGANVLSRVLGVQLAFDGLESILS
jgi:multiple antibiotic resistance protein